MIRIQPFLVSVQKELLLLLRDRHGLLLIFVMPAVFVLIMSLALQEEFSARGGKKIQVLVIDRDNTSAADILQQRLDASGAFATESSPDPMTAEAIKATLAKGGFAFAVDIATGYDTFLVGETDDAAKAVVTIWVAADTAKQTEQIFTAVLREIIARQRMDALAEQLRESAPEMQSYLQNFMKTESVAVNYAYRQTAASQAPTAVQQNVPAWLVFGAFFIVIPLSNTLIRERQSGMLRRLQSSVVSWRVILASKWITFFTINQLQMLLMLAVGIYLVPLLGGEALQIHGSLLALEVVAAALSVAALGYALLIAAFSKTTEQATLLGGAGNIILAALGGIMVPRFIMPPAMQTVSDISPMAWGLNGFLDVLLRDAGWEQLAPKLIALCAFGLATLGGAYYLLQKPAE